MTFQLPHCLVDELPIKGLPQDGSLQAAGSLQLTNHTIPTGALLGCERQFLLLLP